MSSHSSVDMSLHHGRYRNRDYTRVAATHRPQGSNQTYAPIDPLNGVALGRNVDTTDAHVMSDASSTLISAVHEFRISGLLVRSKSVNFVCKLEARLDDVLQHGFDPFLDFSWDVKQVVQDTSNYLTNAFRYLSHPPS